MQCLREIYKERPDLCEILCEEKDFQVSLKEFLLNEDDITKFEAINALDDLCLDPKSKFQRNTKIIEKLVALGFSPLVDEILENSKIKISRDKSLDEDSIEILKNLEKYSAFLQSYLAIKEMN